MSLVPISNKNHNEYENRVDVQKEQILWRITAFSFSSKVVLVFIETGQAAFEEGGGGVVVYTAEEGAVPDCFEITSSDIAVAWAFVITNNYLLIQLKAILHKSEIYIITIITFQKKELHS